MAREIVPIPPGVTRPEDLEVVNKALRKGLALIEIRLDGAWGGNDVKRGTDQTDDRAVMYRAVMREDGTIYAESIDMVCVLGADLKFWFARNDQDVPEFMDRHARAFGRQTTELLRKLSIAVIGCSGTGSPVIEQLARLGVGKLVLVDHDVVEEKNLNRIVNATMEDVKNHQGKVFVLARAIERMGLETHVVPIAENLLEEDVLKHVAETDLVFGCMDKIEGRHVLNRLATFYLLPYFDLGVRLKVNQDGRIQQCGGSVHYLQPGRSSLLSRGVYTLEELHAEGRNRLDPAGYARESKEGYIVGVHEDSPAVISLNMQVAAMAVNELLARLHPYRDQDNGEFAIHRISLFHGSTYNDLEGEPCPLLQKYVGRGDMEPFLDLPALSQMEVLNA